MQSINQRRRRVIALGAGTFAQSFALTALTSFAQQPDKLRRIGFLAPRSRSTAANPDELYDAFVAGMNALGYVEGKNLVIEWRFAEGKFERLPDLATELVNLKVEVIVTEGTFAALAAQQATRAIPIVTAVVADAVASGFAASLGRPGGNMTGISNMANEMTLKQLELLRLLIPKLSSVALLTNPTDQTTVKNPQTAARVNALQTAARSRGITVLTASARDLVEFERGLTTMKKQRAGAFILAPDPFFTGNMRQIAALALKHRIASSYNTPNSAKAGGLMGYGPDGPRGFRRAATFVDKILKGAKPGDLPFEQPTLFNFVINRKTAKALGVTISEELQLRADEVIE